MAPGTVTWPTVVPSNTHLRLHLGLVVPSNAIMRVANETRSVVFAASLRIPYKAKHLRGLS